jgi:hypothetical protein
MVVVNGPATAHYRAVVNNGYIDALLVNFDLPAALRSLFLQIQDSREIHCLTLSRELAQVLDLIFQTVDLLPEIFDICHNGIEIAPPEILRYVQRQCVAAQ